MVEWFGLIIAMLIGGAGLTIGVIALASAGGHRHRIDQLARELAELRRGAMPAFVPPQPQLVGAVVPVVADAVRPITVVEVPGAVPEPLADATAIAEAPLRREVSTPPAPRLEPAPAAMPPTTFEERVALVWFTRIGAIILLVGVGFFYKYATDSGWLGPIARLLLGAVAGVAIVAGAELGRARTRPIFLHVITGAGLGILYLVAWASHVLYGLASPPVAFAAFATITLAGGALAVRGRAELVLVFSLVGGFLAPVLLSSGADRPLALFAYLVVLTSLAFAASVQLRFRIAIWIAVAGTLALAIGWFATRFDTSTGAAYAGLASRWPALLGTAAIAVEWLIVAAAMRRTAEGVHPERFTPDGLMLAALVFAHGGAAVLLHDVPTLLGVVATALAVAAAFTVLRTTRRELLAVPLVASAFTLALAGRADGLATVLGSGAATFVYVVALLRGQWAGGRRPDVVTLLMVGAGSACFACVAAVALIDSQPHTFALVVVGLSLGQAVLAIAAGRPLVALVAAVASLLGLAAAGIDLEGARFVGLASGWAMIYIGAAAWEMIALRIQPNLVRIGTVSVAALGLPLLAWSTIAHASLPGGVPALDGAVLVVFGGVLIARKARWPGTILIGEGIGLIAIAVAIQFSGATTVMIWAIMAAVIVALAASVKDGWSLAGGIALFAITLLFALPDQMQVAGEWRLAFLRNPRCATLAVTASALLVSAFAAGRAGRGWFPTATVLLTIAGHVVLVILLLTETANVVLEYDRMLMMSTLILGIYAGGLLGLGFGARNRLHRFLGLGLFAVTLLKLALVDIWSLQRVHQMLVLLGVGALLVAAGFFYARFGRRLVALLRDDDHQTDGLAGKSTTD